MCHYGQLIDWNPFKMDCDLTHGAKKHDQCICPRESMFLCAFSHPLASSITLIQPLPPTTKPPTHLTRCTNHRLQSNRPSRSVASPPLSGGGRRESGGGGVGVRGGNCWWQESRNYISQFHLHVRSEGPRQCHATQRQPAAIRGVHLR